MDKVKVSEVDRPSAQILKTDKIKEIFGSLPHHVAMLLCIRGLMTLTKDRNIEINLKNR